MFKSVLEHNSVLSVSLAIVAAFVSVLAFAYYAGVIKTMWLDEPAEIEITEEAKSSGDLLVEKRTSVIVTPALRVAILICASVTIFLGIYPGSNIQNW
jgi:NADH:ubiquinone oxidoreductase subunit 2 (subunit N)